MEPSLGELRTGLAVMEIRAQRSDQYLKFSREKMEYLEKTPLEPL